jgi:hypothetical protein
VLRVQPTSSTLLADGEEELARLHEPTGRPTQMYDGTTYFSQDCSFVPIIDPLVASDDAAVVEALRRARSVISSRSFAQECDVAGCEPVTAQGNRPRVMLMERDGVL